MAKPIIYIAGPYRSAHPSGVWANIMAAREYAIEVWNAGGIALCPHLNTMLMDGLLSDSDFLEGCMDLMGVCDAVYAMDTWKISEGASREVAEAERLGTPVLYDSVGLHEYIHQYEEFCESHWVDG